MATTTPI
ncbi:hypothetical protein VTL71DRAFT_10326 [Oculimacula yallundae]